MMKAILFLFALAVIFTCAQGIGHNFTNITVNGTNMTEEIASGSGMSCRDIVCTGGGECMEGGMDGRPYCWCPAGKRQVSLYHCEDCPVGYWGVGCNRTCAEACSGSGRVSSCDSANGTCVCNKCWIGDTCNAESAGNTGFECFVDYVASITKNLNSYGGEIPQPGTTKLRPLAAHLLKSDTAVVQDNSATLTVIDRSDVGARPLARLSFTVENQGSTDYNNAINAIKTDVKDGDHRGTLIIDESDGSTAKVTLNV